MDASSTVKALGRVVHFHSRVTFKNNGNIKEGIRCLSFGLKKTQIPAILCQRLLLRSQSLSTLAEQFKAAKEARHQSINIKTIFRTEEDDPTRHSLGQEGLFYTVPEADVKQLFQRGLSLQFTRQAKTFNETSFMIRKPALEVIDCLKHLNFNHFAPRFLLYGDSGNGKTMTIAHILHYCFRDNWMILHAPWPSSWNCHYHETSPSAHKVGRIDLPVESAEWLVNFRSQNSQFIKDIKLRNQYVWTKREVSEAGSPLNEVIEFGLNRMKFASDCVGAILKEIRSQAADLKIKVLVAVDGVNAFWNRTTIKNPEQERLAADKISLVHNYKKMLLSDWTHGAIVCSVDTFANELNQREHHSPYYVLGKEKKTKRRKQNIKTPQFLLTGYKWLDPFVPVHVPNYSEKEAYSCIEYYHDRNWLQHAGAMTEEGKKELIFLSNKNPYQLMFISATK